MENKPEFQGRALDFEEQIALLRSQGLIIEDEKKALHILNNVSYSRLKTYLVPLMEDRKAHRFREQLLLLLPAIVPFLLGFPVPVFRLQPSVPRVLA